MNSNEFLLDSGFWGFLYKILTPVEWLQTWIMKIVHDFFVMLGVSPIGVSWVLAIIILVLVVQACIFPLFYKQMKSMRKMQALAPKMQRIQNKYKGKTDQASREAMSRETMKLYQDNDVNPAGSCLPMLIQGPVFMSMFYTLSAIPYIANGKRDALGAFKVVPKTEPEPLSEAKPAQPYPSEISPTVAEFGKESYGAKPAAAPREPMPATEPQFPVGQQKMNRDPETHLNKNFTFDSFVPGDSNRFARTVALAVAEGSGQDFNPLCIYGGSGLGKTHLLNAIGNYALVKDPGLKVRYVTSEEFTNEFIDALQNPNQSQGQIAEFNRRYRQVDVLLIDDIQFLGGKEAILDQFFHTFNALHQANKRIVIASDVAPKNLKGFEARLISRFESGLTVDVKPPDLETRIAILRMIASMNGSKIPSDVLDLIAERFTENIRELEGALTRVMA